MTNLIETSSGVVRKIRLRAIVFLLLSLIAGAGAVLLVHVYLDRARQLASTATASTRSLVVAAMDIPIATTLDASHLNVAKWPRQHLPAGALHAVDDVVGRTVVQDIVKGEPILGSRLAQAERGAGLAALLTEGKRAMSVKVDQVIGVAGFVHPGDHVDVIATLRPDESTEQALGEKAAKVAKLILQNIRVLAVGEHTSTDGRKAVVVPAVTLEVTPEQAERLALAADHGAIQLTMRARLDPHHVPTEGVTPSGLLQQGAVASRPPHKDEAEAATPEQDASSSKARRVRRHREREERARSADVADPAATEPVRASAPIVEIIRPGQREERKLRPSADSR